MMTESTQPQPEVGPAQAVEQENLPAHRRRRRRRKSKGGPANAMPQTQQPQLQQSPAPPPSMPTPPPAQPRSQHHASTRQGTHPNQPRKKKFSQKGINSQSQTGSNFAGAHQGKRKGGKQKGPREFVGPMDHSYRTVNGNVADGPASTIQMAYGGRNNHYQDNFVPATTAPVCENAVTRIFCFIEDLFFQAKIQETARKLGVKVEFVKGDKEVVTRLVGLPEEERPKLIVLDLNNLSAKPMALIPKFKTKFKKATSIVGFLHHLQGDLKLKALEAGCDTVMPRSAFSQSLPNLLRRYGVQEEEEYTQQTV
jgi:hypothetical protein